MKSELQVFSYQNKNVRTLIIDDAIWWVLKDVCDVINIKNPADTYNRLDDDEKGVGLVDTLGGKQRMNIVNESGLYSVILRSDKEEAKPFRRWVTADVLPTIRKHGAYLTPEKIEQALLDPDTIIQLATALKTEREQKQLLLAELDRSKEWYSIKRVAAMNGVVYKCFDWRLLKKVSADMGIEVKKIFDANYGEVNTYHCSVWEKTYPDYEI